jgi:choline dehydrogenase-like flavoprotein
MQIDSRTVAQGAVIQTDVCIVGAGPAGITLAREFIGAPLRVLVLESGGFDKDDHVQTLSAGEVKSRHMEDSALAEGRQRQFGGTPNKWGYRTEPWNGRLYARSVPPEPRDFTHSDDPSLRWPISFGELSAHFAKAQTVWNGGKFDYCVDTWANGLGQLKTTSGGLETRISQHGPRDVFTTYYRDELLAAENVDLCVQATATSLEPGRAPYEARRVRVAGADGDHFWVESGTFVLACGGVENVQLLLSSEMARPGAIGNRHDNVGRFITDHPEFVMGYMSPADQSVYSDIGLYDIRWVGGQMVSGFLTLSDEVKDSEGLLNMSVAFSPRRRGFGTEAHLALKDIAAGVRQREVPARPFADPLSVLRSPRDTTAFLRAVKSEKYSEYLGGWSGPTADPGEFSALQLWAAFEQTPHRENRLTLTGDRDFLGRQRVGFDHLWSESDQCNIRRSIDIFRGEINAVGLGRIRPWYRWKRSSRPRFHGLHHPMGGTRMHADPSFGVVDENSRVHGLANVYVAGSSVFTTGIGYANPTLTLLALTSRLADHLKGELGAC